MSTVECLVALIVFSLGALGAAGTAALGVRAFATGTHAALVARLAGETVSGLRHQLRIGHQSCAAVSAGSLVGASGETVNWTLTPADRGVDITLALGYRIPVGQHTDTIHGFLPCQ
jgi:hypothetical protein